MNRKEEIAICEMLQDDKESMARIRTEGVIRNEMLILAYELVALHCELLIQRVQFIAQQKECPADLYLPIGSLVYASQRIEVPELEKIVHLFVVKFGREFVLKLKASEDHVSPEIVANLDLTPPSKKKVESKLTSIAQKYEIDWNAVAPEAEYAPLEQEKDVLKGETSEEDDLESRFHALKK